MRRFSLYKRGRIWYVQLFNPATRKYLPGRPTGETDRRAAEHVADDWVQNGIPKAGRATRRPVAEAFEVATLINTIRKAPLLAADAEQLVRALKDRSVAMPVGRLKLAAEPVPSALPAVVEPAIVVTAPAGLSTEPIRTVEVATFDGANPDVAAIALIVLGRPWPA